MNIDKLVDNCNDLIGEYTSFPDDVLYEALQNNGEFQKTNFKEVLIEETGDRGRWSYGMQSVWKVDDKYISFWWDAPATEGQEGQPTNMKCSKVDKKVEMIEKVTYE